MQIAFKADQPSSAPGSRELKLHESHGAEPAPAAPALLVPALSEAKGWHRPRGLGACSRKQEQTSPPIWEGFLEEELLSLNFGQILE